MAEEATIPGSDYHPKIRSLWAVALLPFATLGIYYFVWYYKINKEMVELGRARGKSDELGDSPGTSLLAVTLGALVIVPALVSMYNTFLRIQAAQRITGRQEVLNGWIALALYFVITPAFHAYEQSGLNEVWEPMRYDIPVGAGPTSPTEPAGI